MAGLFVICAALYLTAGAKGNWGFILPFRGTKLAALVLVAIAISTSTVLFQTIARNRILTPSIMGFDALYVLVVTIAVFVMGAQNYMAVSSSTQFFVSLSIMVGISLLLFGTLLLQQREDIVRLILTGIVLAVLFRSLTSFVVRMIDPNEFSVIQIASYANFNQIETDLLGISAVICLIVLGLVWGARHRLDVLALGREATINLGENPRQGALQLFVLITILVSVSTAFVGPIAFLGLLVVSLAHALTPTAHHGILLLSAALISAITLVGGQFVLERLLALSTPLAVVIDAVGGVFFLVLILRSTRS